MPKTVRSNGLYFILYTHYIHQRTNLVSCGNQSRTPMSTCKASKKTRMVTLHLTMKGMTFGAKFLLSSMQQRHCKDVPVRLVRVRGELLVQEEGITQLHLLLRVSLLRQVQVNLWRPVNFTPLVRVLLDLLLPAALQPQVGPPRLRVSPGPQLCVCDSLLPQVLVTDVLPVLLLVGANSVRGVLEQGR